MKRTTVAVLLSTLVIPGAGHVYLKKHLRGIALIIVALSAVSFLLVKASQKALAISDKIIAGEVPLDMLAISAQIQNASNSPDAQLINIVTWVFFSCWLIAAVDAYRLARKLESV